MRTTLKNVSLYCARTVGFKRRLPDEVTGKVFAMVAKNIPCTRETNGVLAEHIVDNQVVTAKHFGKTLLIHAKNLDTGDKFVATLGKCKFGGGYKPFSRAFVASPDDNLPYNHKVMGFAKTFDRITELLSKVKV